MLDKYLMAAAAVTIAASCGGAALAQDAALDLKFAGALEFSDTGALFVDDNYNGAIYAFDMTGGAASDQIAPVKSGDIDVKIVDALGVLKSALAINDMAVHPVTAEIFISVSRIDSFHSSPALVKVKQDGQIALMDLTDGPFQSPALSHFPDQETTFRPRGLGQNPPLIRDVAKENITLSSLAIIDMEYHEGELFVSGVAFDNFMSTLRRVPYPFTGAQSAPNVEMCHISHDQYETRAPIRAMSIHEIDGKTQIVAAYTCSPIVLIDLDEVQDGANITARTLMDCGNDQPLDMASNSVQGEETLFLAGNSRSLHVIPFTRLAGKKGFTPDDFPRAGQSDMSPLMPVDGTGKAIMFDGLSLQIAALGESLFVSMTRDMYTGSLNMGSYCNGFPNRLHSLFAEFDVPQYWEDK